MVVLVVDNVDIECSDTETILEVKKKIIKELSLPAAYIDIAFDLDKPSRVMGKFNIEDFDTDMRWFNGENIGRFPIFPWEVPPKHHKDIIESRKKMSISDNWWGNTKDNVIGIPLTKESPEWKSSTPTPTDQLIDFDYLIN